MVAASTAFAVMYALTTSLGRAGVPWALIGFVRAVVGLVASVGLARARGASLRVFGRRAMWIRSLAGSASSLCIFYAVTHMPLSDAMALIHATPLWIALAARVALREAAGRAVSLALVLGGVSIILIERPSIEIGNIAGAVALAAGILAAIAMVSLRRLSGETPEAVVVHFSAVSTVVMAGTAYILWAETVVASAPSALSIAGLLGVGLAAALGQLLQTRAYAVDRAARVGATGWLQVLLALLIDLLVLGRDLQPSTLLGVGLMVAAGAILMLNVWHEPVPTSDERRATPANPSTPGVVNGGAV
jgi:drug/metabolite transporter (DMT)-like permease